jgi:hypothetical protein
MVDDRTSLYRYFDDGGALIYVGITGRGIARNVEHDKTKDWWRFVAHQEVEHFATRRAALAAERAAIEAHRPPFNTQHNIDHARARGEYLRYRSALDCERERMATTQFRSAGKRSVQLVTISGRTLATLPSEAVRLAGGVYQQDGPILVSTPQRKNAGAATAEMRGGMLALRLDGKYLPDEIERARARINWAGNSKPPTFSVVKVLLNEPVPRIAEEARRGE